jgi:hypothetical protein
MVPPSITYSAPVIDADQKCDEIGHFLRLRGATERNTAKTYHDHLLPAFIVCAGLGRETIGQGNSRFGFDPAR